MSHATLVMFVREADGSYAGLLRGFDGDKLYPEPAAIEAACHYLSHLSMAERVKFVAGLSERYCLQCGTIKDVLTPTCQCKTTHAE